MLTRLSILVVNSQRSFTRTTSLRLLNTSTPRRTSDGDHIKSKADEKAAADLKSRKEERWLDTVASDSEAIVKGEKQHAKKHGDRSKDMDYLQKDTIKAIQEKEAKGHLQNHDVGRRDTHEERIGSGPSVSTKQKKH